MNTDPIVEFHQRRRRRFKEQNILELSVRDQPTGNIMKCQEECPLAKNAPPENICS